MSAVYQQVHVEGQGAGFAILLNGKAKALTPLRKTLFLPRKELAEAVAQEWRAQTGKINKEKLKLTQIACVAVDLVADKRDEVYTDILVYADTDLVCYRAGNIPALYSEQEKLLNPIVAWAKDKFHIELNITDGVMPIAQPAENNALLRGAIAAYDDYKCALLATVTKSLGSVILALAFCEKRINAEEAFILSHLEEAYENEKWGVDAEKEAKMQKMNDELLVAAHFLSLLN